MSAAKLIWNYILPLLFSYDIVCQWFINIFSRLAGADFPSHLDVGLPKGRIQWAIPKYHFNGHEEKTTTGSR